VFGRFEAVKWTDTKVRLEFTLICFEESSKKKREMKLPHI